jgi:hypothetical protein
MKRLGAIVLALLVISACDVAAPVAKSSPTPAGRASAGASATASAALVVPATTAPTPAPATAAPTAPPPPPPPTAKPTPALKAVPPRAARGSTFVVQFTGYPTSPNGVDVVQTVTLPNGDKLAAKTFLAKPDGTGFTTYTPSPGDQAGQHVINLVGGGYSTFIIVIVD